MIRISTMGNLGADPEVRYTQKGTMMVSMRIAVNSSKRGQDGERVQRTDWFRINITGSKAEFAQRLVKGNRIIVWGRLEISEYQARDGSGTRIGYDIWADELMNISAREAGERDNGGGGSQYDEQESAPAAARGPRPAAAAPADLEDLPF